jgi:uncharacterized protein (DUF697 family)
MIKTLQQARAALSHLNPENVRKLAERTVTVGLIAPNHAGYAEMEEVLIPSNAPPEDRARGRAYIFRGGDPGAPMQVDVVLYHESVPGGRGTYTLDREHPEKTLAEISESDDDLVLPLARQFPGLRHAAVERIVNAVSRENAMFAIATALPDVLPSLIEIPWVFGEWASDTAFLTANQIRMAFLIAAACGHEIGFSRQKGQVASIAASAFGWRAIARELVGKIPLGGGLIAKGAVAYAGTYAIGKGLELLHHGEINHSHEEKRSLYREALHRGRSIAQSAVQWRA